MSQLMYNQKAIIKVFGIGGAGCNAVNRMVEEKVQGAEFYVCNTDAQVLESSLCKNKIVLGKDTTKGLGAGGNPEVGRKAALEAEDEIRELMEGCDMVFIAAGMGGGTGTGAAPVFAKIAKEIGALTVGIVTKPFTFEGRQRSEQATIGLEQLREHVDSLILVSNNQLLRIIGGIPFQEAFREADNVLRQGVQTITDLIAVPSFINLDFADIKSVMSGKGTALIGIGMAEGENKAFEAAARAIQSPLLEAQIAGAKSAIVNVTGGASMSIYDSNDAIEHIREAAGSDLELFYGVAINENIEDAIIVTVIATGFDMQTENTNFKPKTRTGQFHSEDEVMVEEKSDLPDFFKNRNI